VAGAEARAIGAADIDARAVGELEHPAPKATANNAASARTAIRAYCLRRITPP
jgi:hypothetical protein